MRAPASDNTLRVHELRERYRLAGKKARRRRRLPAPSGRPGHAHRCGAPQTKLVYRSHSARALSHAVLPFLVAAGIQTATRRRARREPGRRGPAASSQG